MKEEIKQLQTTAIILYLMLFLFVLLTLLEYV
jgi:hypothetical protein